MGCGASQPETFQARRGSTDEAGYEAAMAALAIPEAGSGDAGNREGGGGSSSPGGGGGNAGDGDEALGPSSSGAGGTPFVLHKSSSKAGGLAVLAETSDPDADHHGPSTPRAAAEGGAGSPHGLQFVKSSQEAGSRAELTVDAETEGT